MNRRYFFRTLASGLAIAAAPDLFLPKLIKPVWKPAAKTFRVRTLKRAAGKPPQLICYDPNRGT